MDNKRDYGRDALLSTDQDLAFLQMQKSDQIFTFLKAQCQPWIVGVDQNTLDHYLEQHGLCLREDHYAFILEYGNSSYLLKVASFFNCTFLDFQFTYNHFDEFLLGHLPANSSYFGQDWSDAPLCIDNLTDGLFTYDAMEKEDKVYESIRCFLFHNFLHTLRSKSKFDEVQQLIKVPDVEKFMKDNEQYYLADMDTYDYKYYLNQNMIIELERNGMSTLIRGGILNLLLQDR